MSSSTTEETLFGVQGAAEYLGAVTDGMLTRDTVEGEYLVRPAADLAEDLSDTLRTLPALERVLMTLDWVEKYAPDELRSEHEGNTRIMGYCPPALKNDQEHAWGVYRWKNAALVEVYYPNRFGAERRIMCVIYIGRIREVAESLRGGVSYEELERLNPQGLRLMFGMTEVIANDGYLHTNEQSTDAHVTDPLYHIARNYIEQSSPLDTETNPLRSCIFK